MIILPGKTYVNGFGDQVEIVDTINDQFLGKKTSSSVIIHGRAEESVAIYNINGIMVAGKGEANPKNNLLPDSVVCGYLAVFGSNPYGWRTSRTVRSDLKSTLTALRNYNNKAWTDKALGFCKISAKIIEYKE